MMILITGAGGRVGTSLEAALQAKYPDRVVAATREEIDLTDPSRVILELERLDPRPTVVINCAARTRLPGPGDSPEALVEVNALGVETLSRATRELGCRLIHLSSVDVFSGSRREAYREEDPPDAVTAYGKSRALGETAAARGNPDHLILRMSALFGDGAENDPLEIIHRSVLRGEPIPWEDRRITPLWMEDFLGALGSILRSEWTGVLHLGNAESALISEVASETARLLGAPPVPDLIGGSPGPASFHESSGPNAALECARFTSLSGRRTRSWRQALAASLEKRED
ncbi:MAG TPA: sugar nucleotide-binding protein [Candidatus Polarisedimenticolia bacterium]|nr:sugar nucleotide-binding protein [Candidatus Polarisedimenticolia bacterium]